MKHLDRIIIGGGAAGLYCAATSLSKVNGLIIEKSQRPGLKLLLSGSGQCNITHGGSIKDFLDCYGKNGKKIRSVLYAANNQSLMSYIESIGVPLMTRPDDKVFPKSLKASDVLNALLKKASENGYFLALNESCQDIKYEDGKYIVTTDKDTYSSDKLIISCGGKSYPKTGSDGSIYPVLESLGIEISELSPALTPVYVHGYKYKENSGISFKKAHVKIYQDNKLVIENTDDLLLTHRNFSGPAVINISRYINSGMTMEINYLNPMTKLEAEAKIKKDFQGNKKEIRSYISKIFRLPAGFAESIIKEAGTDPLKKTASVEGEEIEKIANALCCHRYDISGRGSFAEAMVTQGGVLLDEITVKTMESKKYKGLYFIGEVLDIDGDTGGYNLQFAYSSAMAANKDMG